MTTDTNIYPTITDPAPSNGTGPGSGTGPSSGTDPATTLRPVGPVSTRPLADFLPGGSAADHLVVTLPCGDQVVVLRQGDDGQVEVWSFGHITRTGSDTPAGPVTDPVRREGLLVEAVRGLAELRNTVTGQAARVIADRDRDRDAHEQVLTSIRAYAVDKHQNGDICRSGLNEFLEHFGLPVFEPRVRVRYTLSGSYDVEVDDADAARRDADGYLRPDLSQLDNVIDDSDTFSVHVEDVEELDS